MSPPDWPLLSLLACPDCRGELEWSVELISCLGCGRHYPIVDGIPVFADPETDLDPRADYKLRQMEYFDGVLAEFEIERPNTATPLYRWLMDEKHRRALKSLTRMLEGTTALTVCGGSGMDGEYLARAGARVIVSDISLGAAFRARERSRRHGLDLISIVADAERLPFADGSVDVVLVHDGLHHLADPRLGVAEMARVAHGAVSINEPARAAATAVAVKLGIAFDREEAGNRVERLEPAAVIDQLADVGFRTIGVDRYAMYYRHHPGRASKFLSRPVPLAVVRIGLGVFNAVAGGTGNKLALRAMRVASVYGSDESAPQLEQARASRELGYQSRV